MRWDNNQPEVGCKLWVGNRKERCWDTPGPRPGRKPNRKMAFLWLQIRCQYRQFRPFGFSVIYSVGVSEGFAGLRNFTFMAEYYKMSTISSDMINFPI